jgi:hypothetical protein
VACHVNSLNQELEGQGTLITVICDISKAFEFELQLWENQFKPHNRVHMPHLKSFDTTYPERIQEYSNSILLLGQEFWIDARPSKLWNQNLGCLLYLKRRP